MKNGKKYIGNCIRNERAESKLESILKNPRKHRDMPQKYIKNGTERGVNQNPLDYLLNTLIIQTIVPTIMTATAMMRAPPIDETKSATVSGR